MTTHFDNLESAERIERVESSAADVLRLHAVVDRDLATAVDLRDNNRDWALAICYNAMLQACHALMLASRYRAKGENQHRTTIEFAAIALPEADALLDKLNRIRRRRHRAVYDTAGQTTAAEVGEALELADQLIPLLKSGALMKLRMEGADQSSNPGV